MEKKALFKWEVLLFLLVCLFLGCSKKDKIVKTVQGDPEILYKQGLTLFNKRNYSDALKKFEELKSSFPDSPPYTLWAELKIGDCHFQKKDYPEAIASYEEFRKIHPTHEEIPYVYYQIGMSHFNQIRTPDRDQNSTKKALSSFEYLVANYPPNLFTEKAKNKIEVCKKHLADNEFEIAKFYYQQGKFQIAIIRFLALLEKFPKISGVDRTLFFLGLSYLGVDQKEKAKEAFTKIVNEYPKSPHTKESRAILNRDLKKPEKKILFVKIKEKEIKKREKGKETGGDGSPLVKFEDERRQPVPLGQEKKGEWRKTEERRTSLPMTREPVQAVHPREEAKPKEKKEAIEEARKESKVEPQREIKPEEIKRPDEGLKMAMIPAEENRKAIPPKVEPGVEAKPKKERQPLAIPMPSIQSKKEEKPIKEALPESGSVKGMDTGQPIDITSDRVETYSKENLVVFKGNVIARQKDVVIYADRLEAVIIEDGKGIERVVANGNVKIQQGGRTANCQNAVFYNLDQKVVLTGDPKVWEGDNTVSGDEIIFDIKQDRVEVKGGQGEGGKARIYPGEKIEKLK
jgi:outer membrane protein assembly factor BamD